MVEKHLSVCLLANLSKVILDVALTNGIRLNERICLGAMVYRLHDSSETRKVEIARNKKRIREKFSQKFKKLFLIYYIFKRKYCAQLWRDLTACDMAERRRYWRGIVHSVTMKLYIVFANANEENCIKEVAKI